MTFRQTFLAAAIVLAAAPALAAPVVAAAAVAAPVLATPALAVPNPAVQRQHRGIAHHRHGVRFDAPNRLLRAPGTLINGLPPEPAEFD